MTTNNYNFSHMVTDLIAANAEKMIEADKGDDLDSKQHAFEELAEYFGLRAAQISTEAAIKSIEEDKA